MNLINAVSPHIKNKSSTFKKMMEFLICLCVLWSSSAIFYFVKRGVLSGFTVLLNGAVSIIFSVLADCLYNLPLLFDKKFEGNRFKEYLYRLIHSYSYVTGLILALLCTIGIKWWEIGLTSFISTFIMKLLFGGFGKNILNPAVFGRVFAQLCFASDMKTYILDKPDPFNITTGASLTDLSDGFANVIFDSRLSFGNVLIGNYFGTLGETFALLLIVICVYLCVRKIIDWRVPVFYIGSLLLSFIIMFLSMGLGVNSFRDALVYTFAGGIMFDGIICLTDPVTSPTSRSGRVIYALLAALATLVIRTFIHSPEGVAYSVIIVNCFVPFIDKIINGRTNKNLIPNIVCSSIAVLLIIVSLTYGLTNKVDPKTGHFLKNIIEAKL